MKRVLLLALLALSVSAHGQTAGTWVLHRVIILSASSVQISHLGVHTHANSLLFQVGRTDVTSLRADANVRSVRVIAHCRFPTDKAAMPPGFTWLANNYGPVPSYGAIDGNPGWSVLSVSRSGIENSITVSVPTRFANWLAAQAPAVSRRYLSRRNYSLEIDWEQITGSP